MKCLKEHKEQYTVNNAAACITLGLFFFYINKANIKPSLSLVCAAATWPVTVTHILQLFSQIDWIGLILCVIHDSLILSNHFWSSVMPSYWAAWSKTDREKEKESWERQRAKEKHWTKTPALVTNHQRPSSTAKISKYEPKHSGC